MQRKPERIDDIGMGGFKVVQGDGFSYGIDAVLLAAKPVPNLSRAGSKCA